MASVFLAAKSAPKSVIQINFINLTLVKTPLPTSGRSLPYYLGRAGGEVPSQAQIQFGYNFTLNRRATANLAVRGSSPIDIHFSMFD